MPTKGDSVHLVEAEDAEVGNTLCNLGAVQDRKAPIMSKRVVGVLA